MQSSIVAILCFVFKSLQPNPSFSLCWTHCLSHLGCIWRHLNSNDVQWWIKIMILKESIFWCEDFSLWRGAQVPGHVTAATNMKKSNHQESQCSMIIFLSRTHTHINTNWCYHRLEGKKLACRSLSAYPSVFSASSTPWDHPWLSGWWTYNKIIMTAIIIVMTNHHLCSVMSCKRCHQAHSSLYQPIKLRDQLVGVNKEERARIMTFCPALFTRKLTKISSTLGASSKTHQGLISAAAFVPGRILKYIVW